MNTKLLIPDQNRQCEAGHNLSAFMDECCVRWGCTACNKGVILESITRADIDICCQLCGVGSPEFICYVLETLHADDWPTKGLKCGIRREEDDYLPLRYGFTVSRYFLLEGMEQEKALHRFAGAIMLPLFEVAHKRKWGRGYRTQVCVESHRLIRESYAEVGAERWAFVSMDSDVLNRLNIDESGFLR